jgi:hypothetical protein
MGEIDLFGPIKTIKKNSVIKNVKYVTCIIGDREVTIQLDPPRNLKVNNRPSKR